MRAMTYVAWTPEQIRALRGRCDLTQEEFAAICRVKTITVRCWERGRGDPSGPATYVLDDIQRRLDEGEPLPLPQMQSA